MGPFDDADDDEEEDFDWACEDEDIPMQFGIGRPNRGTFGQTFKAPGLTGLGRGSRQKGPGVRWNSRKSPERSRRPAVR